MESSTMTSGRYLLYAGESHDWRFKADFSNMTIRVKFMAKESPAYFIDHVTGEETDCRVIDFIALTPPFFRTREAFEQFKKRCDEIASKGIASCDIVVDGVMYYVAVG